MILLTVFDLNIAITYLSIDIDLRYFLIFLKIFVCNLILTIINEFLRNKPTLVLIFDSILTPIKLITISYFLNSINQDKLDLNTTVISISLFVFDLIMMIIETIRTNKISKIKINPNSSYYLCFVSFMFSGLFILATTIFSIILGFTTFYNQLAFVLPFLCISFVISLIALRVSKKTHLSYGIYKASSTIILAISTTILGFNTRTDFFEFNLIIYIFVTKAGLLHLVRCIFCPYNFNSQDNN